MNYTNPVAQVLAVILGLLLFTAALFVGAFVFLTLLGVAVIGGTILSIRLWWLRHQLHRHGEHQQNHYRHRSRQGLTIEGEVVKKQERRRPEHRG